MDTRQKIEVMQGWLDGRTVRSRTKSSPDLKFYPLDYRIEPKWNWEVFDYELAPEPIVHYCNVYPKRWEFFETANEAKLSAAQGVLRIAVRLVEDPDGQET